MVLGGLEGAHGKRWGDREAEDEGWSRGRAGGARPQGASLGRRMIAQYSGKWFLESNFKMK